MICIVSSVTPEVVMYLVLEAININCKSTVFITTSENFSARVGLLNAWNSSLLDHVVGPRPTCQFS